MLPATWNLNNRAGKTRFRPEAADAAVALGADLIAFTEYFPGKYHEVFCRTLTNAGWMYQSLSQETRERANRVLIASRIPLAIEVLDLPTFDFQFSANIAAVTLPALGLRVVGVRVPAYTGCARAKIGSSWDWLEGVATMWRDTPTVLTGDLNVRLTSEEGKGGEHFRRIQSNSWTRARPSEGFSYYGPREVRSEIDHVLFTKHCIVQDARYVTEAGKHILAGAVSALSDHAALMVEINVV